MNYIVFLYQDRLYNAKMEVPGSFTIGSGKKDDLHIDKMEGQITIRHSRKGALSIESSNPYPFYDSDVAMDTMVVLDREAHIAVYITDRMETATARLKLPYTGSARVGRSDKCHVTIRHPYVSGKHFTIRSEAGAVRVEDHSSTNGLYLNGKRINKSRMHSGDVLSILHINIRLVNNELLFDNVGNDILSIKPLEVISESVPVDKREESEGSGIKYRRSIRTQEQLPTEDIVLANPPAAQSPFEKRGIWTSLLSTGTMFASSMMMGTMSPAMLAARSVGLVTPLVNMATTSSGEKKRKQKMSKWEEMRLEKYTRYIEEQRSKIQAVAEIQKSILTKENPEPREAVRRLEAMDRTLWERGPADRDFLDIRLGMGYEKLCVDVKSRDEGEFRMEVDDMKQLMEFLAEESRLVDEIPARLQMKKYSAIGVVGDRSKMIALIKNMLVSLTYAHCNQEVRVVGIFDKEEKERWEALRWLPHVWDNEKEFRYLAFDESQTNKLSDVFGALIKDRRDSQGDSYRDKRAPLPHYVFLLGSRRYMENSDQAKELQRSLEQCAPGLGITTLFLYDDLYYIPPACQFIVDVNNDPSGYVRTEVNNKFMFTMDAPVEDRQFDAYARRMSAIELDSVAGVAEIPRSITFLEGYGVSHVEELNAYQRWTQNQPYRSMAAPVGVMKGNRVFSLDINEAVHGVHGLVAGTTGSGKSELLLTWILSMAVHYHPHDVAFVIIDYKGGGMANQLEALPHMVGKITNIGSNIGRSLVSLDSELKRRQHIFEKYGVSHIDKYQKLYRDGKAADPLPHLILVSDEFAELKTQEPEFMKSMDKVFRIGRSLGVHAVLATQKPMGVVTDEMVANSSWRLCMKVANAADSNAMLKTPDAALITQRGRSYVQIPNQLYEQFQSYWSGAPYMPGANVEENSNPVCIVDMDGTRSDRIKKEKTVVQSDKTQLEAVMEYLQRVMKENHIKKLDGPWLPELPETVTLDELEVPGGFDGGQWRGSLPWLKVPIGIFDAPVQQIQDIQYINFAEEGHYGIYGAPGTGKTTLLKNVVWALGRYYTPEDVNIYILDCGGWSMNVFAGMPHMGGIALDFEEEKFVKLQQMLMEEINDRKRRFLRSGVSSLTAYRQIHGGGMPAIVLAIDNIVPIFEMYPDMENLFVTLASQGSTYGIYMIYTSNTTTGVRYKVLQNIRGGVAFEMTDKGDYTGIVGRLDGMVLTKNTGRAFFKGASPMEFQAALYEAGETEQERSEALKAHCARMDKAWGGARPAAIPVMPEELSYEDVFKNYSNRAEIPVGLSYETIQPAKLDLTNHYCMVISGTMGSGKSRMLTGIVRSIHEKRPQDQFYVFDSPKGSLQQLSSIAAGYVASNAPEQEIIDVLMMVSAKLTQRMQERDKARAEAGGAFSEQTFIEPYEQICIVIDDIKSFFDDASDRCVKAMERFCKLANGLGVLVLAAGRVSDLISYSEYEPMTRAILGRSKEMSESMANQRAIAIGDKPSLHSFLYNNLDYKAKEAELAEGDAMFYNGNQCYKIKLPR